MNDYILAAKVNAQGSVVWQQTYNTYEVYNLFVFQNAIQETPSGSLVIAGRSVVLEADASGNQLWANQNPSMAFSAIAVLGADNYALAGTYTNSGNIGTPYVVGITNKGQTLAWDNNQSANGGVVGILPGLDGGNQVLGAGYLVTGQGGTVFTSQLNIYNNFSSLFQS